MVAECMKDLCRTCEDRSENYIRIYDTVMPDNIPFYHIINDLCQLGIHPKDGFPEYICKDCFDKIFELVVFRKKCHDSKTNFINMGKSESEEVVKNHGTEGKVDSAANEMEVDLATKTIVEQMDTGCAVEAAGVLKDILDMPFDLVYEEVVVEEDSNAMNKKTVDEPKERQVKKTGIRRKRGRKKSDITSEGTIMAYKGKSPEEIPRTLSVAQSYYAYLLKKKNDGTNDHDPNPRCVNRTSKNTSSANVPSKETPSRGIGSETQNIDAEHVSQVVFHLDNSPPFEINNTPLNNDQVERVVESSEQISEGINNEESNCTTKEVQVVIPLTNVCNVEPTISEMNEQPLDTTTSQDDLGTPTVKTDLSRESSDVSFVLRLETEDEKEKKLHTRKSDVVREPIVSTMKLCSEEIVGSQTNSEIVSKGESSTNEATAEGSTGVTEIIMVPDDKDSSLSPERRTDINCLPPEKNSIESIVDVQSNCGSRRESQRIRGVKIEWPVPEKRPTVKRPHGKRIRCDYCSKMSYKMSVMEEHLKNFHMEKIKEVYECLICGSEFVEEEFLTNHTKFHEKRDAMNPDLPSAIQVNTGKQPLECPMCGVTIKGSLGLFIHNVEVHLNQPVYPCIHCKFKFLKEERKELHEKNCAFRYVPCGLCNRQIMAKCFAGHLTRHKGQERHLCPVCGRSYVTKSDFSRHMRQVHYGQPPKRNCLCAYCPKAYFTPNKLRIHELTHSAEKPFKCGECGRGFGYEYSLRKHKENRELYCLPVIQKASKPYTCVVCRKGWDKKAQLKRHIDWVHEMKRPELAFACEVCPKKFYTHSLLKSHMVVHTTEKAFSCTQCGMRFRYRCSLKLHIRNIHPIN